MRLCVAIPALNEEDTIVDVLSRVPRRLPGITEVVVVVIDDGSKDRTKQLAEEAGAIVVSHPSNLGVGATFQTGLNTALSMGVDLMVTIDGDGQFAPEDIPKLLEPLLSGEADFVTASRFVKKEFYPVMPRAKFFGNKMMSALISFLTGNRFHDVSCGFRAYTRDALLKLNLFGKFTYTQEVFLQLSFKGVRIREVPCQVRGTREFGKSRVASNLITYAYQTSKIIFRSFCDYRPLRVFGFLVATLMVAALCLLLFLLYHYVRTGSLSPHKWAGFVAGFLVSISLIIFASAIIADMLYRLRANQERIMYMLKTENRACTKPQDSRAEDEGGPSTDTVETLGMHNADS